MEQKIDVAQLLKGCPTGMELDCTLVEGLEFDSIVDNEYLPIRCRIKHPNGGYNVYNFTKYGCWLDTTFAKCVIFPKGKTTWEGFVPPCQFKDGDIIFTHADCLKIGVPGHTWISIFEENRNGGVATYVDYCNEDKDFYTYLDDKGLLCMKEDIIQQRLATEEEKQKLFQAIKANSYKWNEETKTLEKLEKEYPKTYKECCKVLDYCGDYFLTTYYSNGIPSIISNTLNSVNVLTKLIICRNAYWKIAGEELGLGKPWEPDWQGEGCYVIVNHRGDIVTDVQWHANAILAFPTEEMRDTFYVNFKNEIEQCKELL